MILEIEVDGARQVLKKTPDAIAIFLLPPSAEELAQRLCGRGTEAEHVRKARLDKALEELGHAGEFHYRRRQRRRAAGRGGNPRHRNKRKIKRRTARR